MTEAVCSPDMTFACLIIKFYPSTQQFEIRKWLYICICKNEKADTKTQPQIRICHNIKVES